MFSLDYAVRGPLATVFTPAAMTCYLRVSQLLWRLKRVEHSLAASWTMLKSQVERTLPRLGRPSRDAGLGAAAALLRRLLLTRNEMSHFATNFQYYVMFEVLETSTQEFDQLAAGATDLESLLAGHEAYLATVLRKALLDDSVPSQQLRAVLVDLLGNMLSMQGISRLFVDQVLAAEARVHARSQRAARGGWGALGGDGDSLFSVVDLQVLAAQLDKLHAVHHERLAAFTDLLPAQAHEEVRFLLYRLDFSEYYNNRRRTTESDYAD